MQLERDNKKKGHQIFGQENEPLRTIVGLPLFHVYIVSAATENSSFRRVINTIWRLCGISAVLAPPTNLSNLYLFTTVGHVYSLTYNLAHVYETCTTHMITHSTCGMSLSTGFTYFCLRTEGRSVRLH